jgi:hypothetical protein
MAPTQQHGSIMQQGCGSTWTWYTKVSKWASEEGTPNLIFQLSFYVTYRPGPTPEEETSVFIEFVGCMIYDEYWWVHAVLVLNNFQLSRSDGNNPE